MGLKRFRASALALGLASMLSMVTVLPGSAASTTVTVAPANLESSKPAALTNDKWFFYNDENDTIDNTLGSFVTGPATPPLGTSSAQISVSGTQRRNVATYRFRGTKLADITTLKYSTYNPSAGNGGSATRSGYLQFNVDFNGSDTWQSRLTYLPSQNGVPIVQNQWQEWDTINGTALWGWSRFAKGPDDISGTPDDNTWPDGVNTPLRTWSSIITSPAFGNARIRATDAFFGIRVGEPYGDGYTENIDAIKFGTGSDVTTFDFEQIDVATDKDECKGGGWKNVTRANGSTFKNQGDCVSYTNTGR